MCGIIGFTGSENLNLLKSMNQMIFHRGPDDDGYYTDNFVNLGMRRLSIVDIGSGKQPISNEDGTIWIVFNGEIYNHEDLRRQLEIKGHRFKTDHCDTEVITHLYEEYAERWADFVNGMFAVAIWDLNQKKLLLYRDRIGKKPLYYANINGQLVFASEIKAILKHPSISHDLDYGALFDYFGLKNISAPSSAFKEIRQVMPGFYLTWQAKQMTIQPYWRLDFSHPFEDITETEAIKYYFDLVEDAVKLRMNCDAPYGAYLSGGVDSTSVVTLMSRFQKTPVKTFCLGYEDKAEGQFKGKDQDLIYAREMSKKLNTDHWEYILTAEEFARRMPEVISAFDEPFSGAVSTFFLTILIKDHVKVALSGDGADELFGSYLSHRIAFPIENYLKLFARGKKSLKDFTPAEHDLLFPFNTPDQFEFLKGIASNSLSEWRSHLSVFSRGERFQLLSRDFLAESGALEKENEYLRYENQLTAVDALNRSLEIDQKELLSNQILPFVDRLSMAHSVEVRVPYLDYRIIEFVNRLPGRYKIFNGINKYLHKKAMEKILPEKILYRPKEGFVQPIYSWMHGSLKKWILNTLDELPEEMFNEKYIGRLKQSFLAGKQSINAKIWNMVCFSLWYNRL